MITQIYIACIGISFLAGLSSFVWKGPAHLQFFCGLLGLTFVVEYAAVFLVKKYHWSTNIPLYNVFVLVEFLGYAYFFRQVIESKMGKQLINIFFVLFPLCWVASVWFIFGIRVWNSYVIILGSVFTVIFSVLYYYQLMIHTDNVQLSRHSEFWIVTGILIFYSCQLPYLGTLNYLVKNYLSLAQQLLFVLRLLNILMYSIFIYAFLCKIIIRKS